MVTVPGACVRTTENVINIELPSGETIPIQPSLVRGLIVTNSVSVSSSASLAIADHGGTTIHLGANGRIRGVLSPVGCHDPEQHIHQALLELSRRTNGAVAIEFVVALISAKISAMDSLLAQHDRSHVDIELAESRRSLRRLLNDIRKSETVDQARGYEGAASAVYFSAMPKILRSELTTQRRTRRPPQDEINAMLSFGYALLTSEMTATLAVQGLNPSLGVLHTPQRGRPSLALDLIEPLRIAIVDRLVIRAANRGEMKQHHFEAREGGVLMTRDGMRKFLPLYQELMSATAHTPDGDEMPVRFMIDRAVQQFIGWMNQANKSGKAVEICENDHVEL